MSIVQTTEDQTYVFKTSDFGSSWTSVYIASLPTTGTLYLNGVAVTVNQIISATDVANARLTFVPNTDVTTAGSFKFYMGGEASTMSLNVTPDAGPNALASSVQATENLAYTFKLADFGYSDGADKSADPLGSVVVTSLPSDGTLQLNGIAVTANQSITASQISGGQLTFVPTTNSTTAGSFNFKVTDSLGGTTSASAAAMSITIVSSGPAPTAGASSVTVSEDVTYTFKSTDFVYSDSADATTDPMASITITALPTNGTLKYNGTAITTAQATAGFTVSTANIGLLSFVPNTDVTTQGSFQFKVTDTNDNATSGTATMTLHVTADTGPSAGASSVAVTEDQTYTFKASDFVYSDTADAGGDPMASITITALPTNGTLKYNGTAITAAQATAGFTVSAANIGLLSFVPNTDVTTQGSFQFKVTDTATGGTSTTSSAATMTLNVTADAGPSALASSVSVTENVTYTFKTSDFGYSDSADKTADPLGSVIITSLPGNGTLKYNGTAITAAQASAGFAISAGNIGLLTLVPTANVTTSSSFSFEVTDSLGGTTSATAAALTVNISTDPGPTASASTVTVTEDATYTFKASDFVYSDSFDPSDPMASITITSLPTTGTLKYNGAAITAAQASAGFAISTGNVGLLTFVPNTDVTQQGSFSFEVTDTTGGVTSSAATMTLNVTADAGPSALASSITAAENQTYTFKTLDFSYSDTADVTSDPLKSVTVTSLPSDGTLKLNGTAVASGQTILATDISAGNLTFVPNTNSTASGSFSFKVTDSLGGTTSASAAAMSINITVPGATPSPQLSFAAQNFTTVGTDNSGFYMIPPDPNAAVGLNTVISATNGVLEAFTKSGTALNTFNGSNNISLNNFYVAGLGSLVLTNFNDPNQSGPFDPKVIYDPYSNRFIAVALQESDAGGSFNDTNKSNILIAVSSPDTGGALTWKYTSINSDVIANGADSWADYPGLSVDGTGNIYVTANLFDHATGNYQGSRLWTIAENDIVTGAAGTDATASGKATIYDPSVLSGATSAGSSELFTLMPAQLLPGSGAFATPSGTYLVSYDGASNSQGQVLNVIEVTPNGSGGFSFTSKQINLGNIDAAGQFASFTAPQLGTSRTIDAGDDRVYSVVFRNGLLYATTTVKSPSTGFTTAHYFQINASNPASLSLVSQGDVSGASIGSGVRTYYPSISVDANGDFAIGFSASGPNNYASAYYEAYKYNATTNTWTLDSPTLLAGGVASYYRTFGGGDNRWGDFSSIVADPSNPSTFWVYNEYAWTHGTQISGENGRWATQVGEFTLPNTTTGPVVSSSTTSGSSTTTGSTSPSTSTPSFLSHWAELAGDGGQRDGSDINWNANLLVETNHGAGTGEFPPQLAQTNGFGQWGGSDVNWNTNPLVETDHGPGIGVLPSQLAQTGGFGQSGENDINWNTNPLIETDHGPGIGASTSQLAKSLSQLVQAIAAFGADHQDLPELAETQHPDGQTNPGMLVTNLFKQHG